MIHIGAGMVVVAAVLAFATPASAATHHQKRMHPETGPLIMSGSMVPPGARHARAQDICKPVVIRRRPMFSPVWR